MDRSVLRAKRAALAVTVIAVVIGSTSSRAQENCSPIRFAKGQTSATIHGTAPPQGSVCYSFASGAGQTANLRVIGNNMVFTITGVVDDQDSWTFRTKAQTYKFFVSQQMRSVTTERYTVTLSIK